MGATESYLSSLSLGSIAYKVEKQFLYSSVMRIGRDEVFNTPILESQSERHHPVACGLEVLMGEPMASVTSRLHVGCLQGLSSYA